MEDAIPGREDRSLRDPRQHEVDYDTGPSLDRQATDLIGRRLRDYYGSLASEPLPSKIAALLARLDAPGRSE
jgi:hypothetical protein